MHSFFPSYFFEKQIENHEEILEIWKPYINDQTYFDASWSYGTSKTSIRNKKNDLLPWNIWFESINPVLHNFLNQLEPITNFEIICDEFWANIYNKDEFQEPHDHTCPGRSLSLIYFLQCKEGVSELVFECPNFNLIKASGLNRIFKRWEYHHITPYQTQGLLLVFPSWINHYVLPVKNVPRITLSANLTIKEKK